MNGAERGDIVIARRGTCVQRVAIATARVATCVAHVAIAIARVAIRVAHVAIAIARVAIPVERVAIAIARVAIRVATVAIEMARVATCVARVAIAMARVATCVAPVAIAVARVATCVAHVARGLAGCSAHLPAGARPRTPLNLRDFEQSTCFVHEACPIRGSGELNTVKDDDGGGRAPPGSSFTGLRRRSPMGINAVPNKNTALALDQKAVAGVDKYLTGGAKWPLFGASYTAAELKVVFQGDIDAFTALDAARAQVQQQVAISRVSRAKVREMRKALKGYILSAYGAQAVQMFADFGFSPPKTKSAKTAATTANAVVKAKATRVARHTMGKKQKSHIHGAPATQPAKVQASAPEQGAVAVTNGAPQQ